MSMGTWFRETIGRAWTGSQVQPAATYTQPALKEGLPRFHKYLIFYRHEMGVVRMGRLLHGAQDLHDVLGD